jgi:hypothetical protein
MNTNQIEKIINEKKEQALKEARKNRLVFRIISALLLAVVVGMIGLGIDCLVRGDKLTGGLLLGLGIALLGAIITIKVFTERKMSALLLGIQKIGTEEITEDDIARVEIEEALEKTLQEAKENLADNSKEDIIEE